MSNCEFPNCLYSSNTVYLSNDDKKCIFHADTSDKGVAEATFKDLLNVHIRNNLPLDGFIFHIEFNSNEYINLTENKLEFINCKFIEKANFKDCTFLSVVKFSGCTFNEEVNFTVCTFSMDIEFTGCKFRNKSKFENCAFKSIAKFISTKNDSSDTVRCSFEDDVIFNKCNFESDTNFIGCEFKKEVKFDMTNIKGATKFNGMHESNNDDACKFNGIVRLNVVTFSKDVEFIACNFNNYTEFITCEFNGKVFFSKYDDNGGDKGHCKFKKVKFKNIKFNDTTDFTNCKFDSTNEKEGVLFDNINFSNGVSFKYTEFFSSNSNECIKQWDNALHSFSNVQFKGKNADFSDMKIVHGLFKFYNCVFDTTMVYKNCKLNNGTKLKFEDNTYKDENSFFEMDSISTESENNNNLPIILFEYEIFNIGKGIFKNIGDKETLKPDILVLFRYCILDKIFFDNNLMSCFSFFQSVYESAIFYNNRWLHKGTNQVSIITKKIDRSNVLFEDLFLNGIIEGAEEQSKKAEYKLEELQNHEQIAFLYRKFKTSLDTTKDFSQAGKFYYNEFEMKHKSNIQEYILNNRWFKKSDDSNSNPIFSPKRKSSDKKNGKSMSRSFEKISNCFRIFGKYVRIIIYWLYKNVACYGEKVSRATFLLAISILMFALVPFFDGITFYHKASESGQDNATKNDNSQDTVSKRINPEDVTNINYEFGTEHLKNFDFVEAMRDYSLCLFFSLTKVLPAGYSPFDNKNVIYHRDLKYGWSVFLYFLNALFVILLVALIAMGLKRHFRRY